ncbi:MAG TPA: AmmeMemoRadiSam system protein B [Spirochaetia bacterium]|nr:AmmeMemoRadiSam system protein B [Spirochaetia bacterium]
MRIRRRFLPPGWYPDTAERTREMIGRLSRGAPAPTGQGIAGVVPHAGWEFSGRLALEVFSSLSRSIDTIVIIGGHLGPADGIVSAAEEAYETPLGTVAADLELLEELRGAIVIREDRAADNTVEVQLPFVRHLFPSARVLGMRAAPSEDARKLGEAIARVEERLNRRICVVGSTDLTHYGMNYGFQPAGEGARAVAWVREQNDRRFIEALLALDFDAALQRALKERSACSAGGALAALTFASEKGVREGSLLDYSTSYDIHPAESFVGYAGILYQS